MDRSERHTHLFFLLSIAPLYAGCGAGDEGVADPTGQNPTAQGTSGDEIPSTTTAPIPMTSGGMDSVAGDSTGVDVATTGGGTTTEDGTGTTQGVDATGAADTTSRGGGGQSSSGGRDDMGSESTGVGPCPFVTPMTDPGDISQWCINNVAKVNECDFGDTLTDGCIEIGQDYCQETVNIAFNYLSGTDACMMAYGSLNACNYALTCRQIAIADNDYCMVEYQDFITQCFVPGAPLISKLGIVAH